ncbi:MAG: serine--tRNA ligase, partial [Bacilli bacterium]|nr:serine--tRNA ligase [Bacilli bacterium]
MIDIKLIRENREIVKENIKKKFQNEKLSLVDEIFTLDHKYREFKEKGDNLRSDKNKLSSEIGTLMRDKKLDEANSLKKQIEEINKKIEVLEKKETKLEQEIKDKMMVIPQIMHESVPIGKDDTENVEVERFGEPIIPNFEIPYHADILEKINGLDK